MMAQPGSRVISTDVEVNALIETLERENKELRDARSSAQQTAAQVASSASTQLRMDPCIPLAQLPQTPHFFYRTICHHCMAPQDVPKANVRTFHTPGRSYGDGDGDYDPATDAVRITCLFCHQEFSLKGTIEENVKEHHIFEIIKWQHQ